MIHTGVNKLGSSPGSKNKLEPKGSKLWLCQNKMELESSGSSSNEIFGAKKLQLWLQ